MALNKGFSKKKFALIIFLEKGEWANPNGVVIRRSGISGYANAAYPNRRNSFPGGKWLSAWRFLWLVHSLTRIIRPTVCRWIVFFTQGLEHLITYQVAFGLPAAACNGLLGLLLTGAFHLQNGIKQRQRTVCIGCVNRVRAWVIGHHNERVCCAFCTPGSLTPGAVVPAYLPLFGKLLVDLLPVKKVVRVQPSHITLVLWLKCVFADTHKVEIASADLDREVTKALFGGDEGTTLFASHRWVPLHKCTKTRHGWRGRPPELSR